MTDAGDPGVIDPAATEPSRSERAVGIGRASAILASGTIVSRILGFVGATVLAQAIGIIGAGADTFTLANQLPNNVYSLVAGGLLSAVIVPQIVRAGLHDDGGAKFINRLVTLGLVVFVAVTIVATLCAPLLVGLYAQSGSVTGFGPNEFALATAFAYWCLPQILFYALYSLVGETLNARGVFGPFTWAPALNNLVTIAGLVVFIALFGADPAHRLSATWTPTQIAIVGGTATLGIAVQAVALFFFWGRAGLRYRPDFRFRGVGFARTGQAAAWVFGMFLVTQISGVVESRVASLATGQASLGVLKYGWLMFILPHSIVTVSIVTAYFTRMSRHARDGNTGEVRGDLSSALRSILLIMIPANVGLAVLSFPFSAMFAKGDFAVTQALAIVFLGFIAGLIPFTIFFVLLRVYYAMDDTRTPFFIQVAQTAIYVVGSLLVGAYVPVQWIALGLALILSIAMTFQAALSAVFLRRRLGGLATVAVLRQALWFLAASVPAGAAAAGVLVLLGGVRPGSFALDGVAPAILTTVAGALAMALVYFGVLWVTRNRELRAMLGPLLARLPGKR
jgi:putative peptidoglycan lipid II flippase